MKYASVFLSSLVHQWAELQILISLNLQNMFTFSHLPNTIIKLLCKLSNNKWHHANTCLHFHIYLIQLKNYHTSYQIANGIMQTHGFIK